jgi:uncharacterized tellurite resistance protein B-like protein
MLKTLKDLFESFNAPAEESANARHHATQLATAILLVEVMRADPAIETAEHNSVVTVLHEKFSLADDELARLVELAGQEASIAYDYQRFTSIINERFTHEQKIQIVQNLWQVAYADGHLHANENHVISKLAALLYVTHGEYIGAKMRAKEAASLA